MLRRKNFYLSPFNNLLLFGPLNRVATISDVGQLAHRLSLFGIVTLSYVSIHGRESRGDPKDSVPPVISPPQIDAGSTCSPATPHTGNHSTICREDIHGGKKKKAKNNNASLPDSWGHDTNNVGLPPLPSCQLESQETGVAGRPPCEVPEIQ